MESEPAEITVLHVDDEPGFADMAAKFVEREAGDIAVETRTGAQAGLELLEDQPFDCIVSDYDMPGKNGIEFLKAVREKHPELPFILFTGKGSEEIASEAISAGVTDYLQKKNVSDQYTLLVNRIRNAVERTQAVQAVRETETWASTILENASDYCMVVDEAGEISYVSPSVERILGWIPDELVGRDAFDFAHPDDFENAMEGFVEILESPNQETQLEFRAEDANGEYHWMSVRGRNLLDDPVIGGILVNVRDISERKERDQELRMKERAMDAAPIGITITDPSLDDNPIIYVNDGFQRLTGYVEEEILNRNCRFLQGQDTEPEHVDQMRVGIDQAEPVTVVLRNYRKDGSEFWNEVTIAPIETETGEVTHFVGFQQDVSDRMERRKELEDAQRRTEYALEATDSYVFEIDFDSGEERRFGEWNSIHGIGPDEVPTTESFVNRVVHPADQGLVRTVHEEFEPAPDASVQFDYRTHPDNGDVKWVRAKLQVVPKEDGGGLKGIGLATDVTDLMTRREELTRQNERLEEFAGVVSHDLQNPLRVAEGNLELLAADIDSPQLSKAREAIKRMQSLIDELLELTRSGQAIGDTELVELSSIASNCWDRIDSAAASFECEAEVQLEADRSRLAQLLENAFTNAIEHGGDDVTVTVGELPNGFYIEDDGVGIASEERAKVLRAGYTSTSGGSGLGLSIIKRIAEAHDWGVEVTKGRDGGFRIEFSDIHRGSR